MRAPLLPPTTEALAEGAPAVEGAPAAAQDGGGSLGRILALAMTEWPALTFGFVAMVLNSLADLLVPKFFGGLIDSAAVKDASELQGTTLSLVALLGAGAVMSFARSLAFGIAGEKVVAKLRARLFASLLRQDAAFFDAAKSGELISRLASDCTKLQVI
ncbi:ABC transporter type 1, transmembrane domain-containing protein [Pavlovales sp. CCMP2436]|nr:ABC transporter type 1, transmembrane domain-containing protein [Pavlovales sp. CCMP2436]